MKMPQIVALVMIGIIILEFVYNMYLKRKNRKKMLALQLQEENEKEGLEELKRWED